MKNPSPRPYLAKVRRGKPIGFHRIARVHWFSEGVPDFYESGDAKERDLNIAHQNTGFWMSLGLEFLEAGLYGGENLLVVKKLFRCRLRVPYPVA